MAKASHREKILTEGLRVVNELGFSGASVRDIVRAAGVPQGSFTNHFASKEAFGLEILELYFTNSRAVIDATLRNDARPPLERLRAYIDANEDRLNCTEMRDGCLFGNLAAEAALHGDALRARLQEMFAEVRESVAYCLRAAVTAGELPPSTDCDGLAEFVLSSLQGAILLSKAERSPAPLERFKIVLFSMVLR